MLRKILKITVIILALAVVAIQFIRPNFTNPEIVASETLIASTDVPADVQQVLGRSCNDCHSNQTTYPWYSNVTPFNWFLADHIDAGRDELNFSKWNTYATEKKVRKLDEICGVVQRAEMPLPSYLWIHSDATLSESDAKLLCEWANAESERIAR